MGLFGKRASPKSAGTPVTRLAIGMSLLEQDNLTEALPMLQAVLDEQRAERGARDPQFLRTLSTISGGIYTAGRLDKARPLLQELYDSMHALHRDTGGDTHQKEVLLAAHNLGKCLLKMHELELARPLLEEACEGACIAFGREHDFTRTFEQSLEKLQHKAAGARAAGARASVPPINAEGAQKQISLAVARIEAAKAQAAAAPAPAKTTIADADAHGTSKPENLVAALWASLMPSEGSTVAASGTTATVAASSTSEVAIS